MSSPPESKRDVVIVFDLDTEGHHAGYILHLIRYFGQTGIPGRMVIASVPRMLDEHPDLAEDIASTPHVSFRPVDIQTPPYISGRLKLPVDALVAWKALRNVCIQESATHAMLMYADALLQVPIALGLRAACPFSAIYFRPIFHYDTVSPLPLTTAERRRGRRQKYLLRRAMRHPDLSTLFTLDSFAAPKLNSFSREKKAQWLADPVDVPKPLNRNTRRDELGVDEKDTMLLLFGVLSSRKGIREVLEAVRLLPADTLNDTTLCLVGPIHESTQQVIQDARIALGDRLKIRDGFVDESDVQSYFDAADVVLAPYPRHVGMSAVLIRAAAANRPVISSSFGLMGALVQSYGLGIAVDAREPAALAEAILDLRRQPGDVTSAENMKSIAEAHRIECFAQAIVEQTFVHVFQPTEDHDETRHRNN